MLNWDWMIKLKKKSKLYKRSKEKKIKNQENITKSKDKQKKNKRKLWMVRLEIWWWKREEKMDICAKPEVLSGHVPTMDGGPVEKI